MYLDVLEKEIAVTRESGLDALVAISPENFAYLTGFVVPSQPILRWRHAATVVTADGVTGVLSVDMEATTVRTRLPGVDVRVWEEFEGNAVAVLAQLLRDLGLKAGRIGVEMDYLPARDMEQLRSRLPSVRWEAAEGLFDRMRMVKSPREVDLLRRLSRITDTAIGSALGAVRAGDNELDLAAAVTGSLYAGGAEHHKLLIVATGERSRFPNVGPTDRVLSPGDLIRLEIFGVIGGYHAGVCRTAVVGDPSEEARQIYTTLVDCRRAVLEVLRPGASARDVYRRYLEVFGTLGYDPIPFVGHGIGLQLHEPPYLRDGEDARVEAGMAFGVEPLLYGPEFGLQIKDMVAVGAEAAEVLSDVTPVDALPEVPA